jgi:aldose 1-epimerase
VTPPPSRPEYDLAYGRQRAVIVTMGAGLREYGTDLGALVDGYGRDQACDGSRGQLLVPWPNRIAGARYRFGGAEFLLPVNEPRTGSAIHGLARDLPWSLASASRADVTLTLELAPQQGYPFSLFLSVTYALAGDGLTVQLTATNRGEQPCPYGAGAHPYVRVAGCDLIDDVLLHIPADAVLESDDRGIPTGAERDVAGTAFDFRAPRPVGALVLDTAFTRPHADADGVTRITLTARDGSHGVAVWMDRSHHFAMIYSGDTLPDADRRRRGLAVEPMTCAPDAFNSGAGLIVLQPGEAHGSSWGIAPL